jgi:hypothetical protein
MDMDFKHFYSNSTSYNIYIRRHTSVQITYFLLPSKLSLFHLNVCSDFNYVQHESKKTSTTLLQGLRTFLLMLNGINRRCV